MTALNTNTSDALLGHSAGIVASAFETFRRARDDWEQNKENDGSAATDTLFEAYANGLDEYLLTPATTLVDLTLKLHVIDDEEIWRGWHRGQEIFALLAHDAQSIASQGGIT